jgi:hypothetical protein
LKQSLEKRKKVDNAVTMEKDNGFAVQRLP